MKRTGRSGVLVLALCAAACGGAAQASSASDARQQGEAMAAMHHDDAPVASLAVQAVPPGSVEGKTVTYGKVAGKDLKGYFVRPAGAAGGPGVIMFHEWWGLNDNIRRMADRLAAQGYLVLAADLYDGHAAEKPDEAQALMQQALGGGGIDANIQAAYDWLRNNAKAGKIGTLGWCFGGSMSFEAGQVLSGKTAATVIYYGFVNDHPDELGKLTAPVAGFFGGQDQGIPPETVQGFRKELEAEGKHPLIRIYPEAKHAFANPSGKSYRKDDAEDAWRRTLDFLAANLKA